ncbi:MAG: WecB/TagA/CpsF family glycosyltransferase [Planctomycetales bacterium]|nr:WecB/TagA/CpsF family glycosyltransferase [Planctomycetales bacterium]
MIDLGKKNLLGIGMDAVDYDGAVARVVRAAELGEPYAVSALAVHGLMTGVLDKEHRYRLNRFDLLTPDGQPVRWALNWLHRCRLPDRVYGPNLMLRVCEAAANHGLPIYLFGGTPEMLKDLSKRLVERYPSLQIAGQQASRFRKVTPDERNELVDTIRASGAKITFVGLGCPRQEIWTYELRERLSMPLLAVGAAFAFHAGQLEQAPRYLQDRGLEWAYRLTREPKRLWRRYVYLNPLYLSLLAGQAVGLYRPQSAAGQEPQEELLYG